MAESPQCGQCTEVLRACLDKAPAFTKAGEQKEAKLNPQHPAPGQTDKTNGSTLAPPIQLLRSSGENMATRVHTNSNTPNPFHPYKPHTRRRGFITAPPRQPRPHGLHSLPPPAPNQLMRDMQMMSLWDYALSDSSAPRSAAVLIQVLVNWSLGPASFRPIQAGIVQAAWGLCWGLWPSRTSIRAVVGPGKPLAARYEVDKSDWFGL